MADWRSSFQNWTTLLPLLVSQSRLEIFISCIGQPCTINFTVGFKNKVVHFDWTYLNQTCQYVYKFWYQSIFIENLDYDIWHICLHL